MEVFLSSARWPPRGAELVLCLLEPKLFNVKARSWKTPLEAHSHWKPLPGCIWAVPRAHQGLHCGHGTQPCLGKTASASAPGPAPHGRSLGTRHLPGAYLLVLPWVQGNTTENGATHFWNSRARGLAVGETGSCLSLPTSGSPEWGVGLPSPGELAPAPAGTCLPH